MANLYSDNPDLVFTMNHIRWDRFVPLLEDDFTRGSADPLAPSSLEEAVEAVHSILDLVGELAANEIAPAARDVDRDGCRLEDGQVRYAPATLKHREILRQAGLLGLTLPRESGGQGQSTTLSSAIGEMVAAADASLHNLMGLPWACGETLADFASEDICRRYLPVLASGERAIAMALTEPQAGSDLPSVQTRATCHPEDGTWTLSGSKIFITDGGADLLLVLARSEPKVEGARGLSFFLVERSPRVEVIRLEEKLGIHGSPTCQIQFNDAPGLLVGERRKGLTHYTFSMLSSARLGVAAQALGIAQAAADNARRYAATREQFGKVIRLFPPVRDMLVQMQVDLEAARSIVYATSQVVDRRRGLERHLKRVAEDRRKGVAEELKKTERLASLLTALAKYHAAETANRVASSALQVHGGYGYMREYDAERYFRDARITNIYEGTSQIQVGGAINGILSGGLEEFFRESWEALGSRGAVPPELEEMQRLLNEAVAYLKGRQDRDYLALWARSVVDMAADLVAGCILCRQAPLWDHKEAVARKFLQDALRRAEKAHREVTSGDRLALDAFDRLVYPEAPIPAAALA